VDFWLLAGRLFRRWYLALPLLLAATAVATEVASSVRPSYSSSVQVLLAPSGATGSADPTALDHTNPLLLANRGQLDAATQSVVFVVESPAGAADRAQRAPGAKVRFGLVQEAPIVTVDVSASHPATVQQGEDVAVDQVQDALGDIEDQLLAGDQARIEAVRLGTSTVQRESGDRRRVLIGGLGSGLLGTALVVLALDQLLRRRQERRLSAGLERQVGRWAEGMAADPSRPRSR
jgi:hypothetical protein